MLDTANQSSDAATEVLETPATLAVDEIADEVERIWDTPEKVKTVPTNEFFDHPDFKFRVIN